MKRFTWKSAAAVCTGLAAVSVSGVLAQRPPADTEWRYFGGDKGFQRYAPLDQINRGNVTTLKVAWRRAAADPLWKQKYPELRISGNLRSTPVLIGGTIYAPTALGLLRAIEPATGETLWEQQPVANTIEEVTGQSSRGVDYWRSGSAIQPRLIHVRGEYLYAVNPKDGTLFPDFGDKGRVNLHFDSPTAGRYS